MTIKVPLAKLEALEARQEVGGVALAGLHEQITNAHSNVGVARRNLQQVRDYGAAAADLELYEAEVGACERRLAQLRQAQAELIAEITPRKTLIGRLRQYVAENRVAPERPSRAIDIVDTRARSINPWGGRYIERTP